MREKAKIIRKNHSRRENLFESEYTLIGVVCKFVAAARRRFNDDLDQAFLDQGL